MDYKKEFNCEDQLQMEIGHMNKVTNSLFRMLNEREEGKNWKRTLDSIFIELMGLPDERKTINYLRLCYKLSCLRYLDLQYFKNTVFECMGLCKVDRE